MRAVKVAVGYAVVAVAFFALGRLTAPTRSERQPPKKAERTSEAKRGSQATKAAPALKKRAETAKPATQAQRPSLANVADDPSPSVGPKDALVIVHEILDFQCPVCKRSYYPMKQLTKDFPAKVRLVFKHNPLKMHRNALDAAAASIAAARQGKFWEYADILFENQRALSVADLEEYAQRLGLDLERFRRDMNDERVRARAELEGQAASQLGARGTPSFFINGKMQVGWASYASIAQQVRNELKKTEALVAQGMDVKEARRRRVRENLKEKADQFLNSALGVEYDEP